MMDISAIGPKELNNLTNCLITTDKCLATEIEATGSGLVQQSIGTVRTRSVSSSCYFASKSLLAVRSAVLGSVWDSPLSQSCKYTYGLTSICIGTYRELWPPWIHNVAVIDHMSVSMSVGVAQCVMCTVGYSYHLTLYTHAIQLNPLCHSIWVERG